MEVAQTGFIGFIQGVAMGLALGMLILGVLYTSSYFHKFRAFKRRMLFADKGKQA